MGAVSSCCSGACGGSEGPGFERCTAEFAAGGGFRFTGCSFDRSFAAGVSAWRFDGRDTTGSAVFQLASSTAKRTVCQIFGFRTAVTAKPGRPAGSAASRAFLACTNAGAAAGRYYWAAHGADAFYRYAGLRDA